MQKNTQMGRRSIRLRGHDYRAVGRYFVTICTKNKAPIFGTIKNGKMVLSAYGYIAKRIWKRGKRIWKNVHSDAFIVMPNHIHMIISIKSVGATPRVADRQNIDTYEMSVGATPRVAPQDRRAKNQKIPRQERATQGVARTRDAVAKGPASGSVGAFIGSYKSSVARVLHQVGLLNSDIWHRNYFERIIRSDDQLFNTSLYIRDNPVNASHEKSKYQNRKQSSDGVHE